MVKGLIFCVFFLSAFQEMYKASKYEVSPDMKHVLLAYNVAPVSAFICLRVFGISRMTGKYVIGL